MLKGFNYFLELCAGMAGEMSSRLRGRANTRGKLGPQWYFHTRTLLYQSKNWRVCIFSFNLGELHKILHKEHIVQGTQDGDRFRFEYQLHQLWTSDQLIQPTQCPTSPHPSDLPPDSFPTAKAASASTVSPSALRLCPFISSNFSDRSKGCAKFAYLESLRKKSKTLEQN